MPKKHEAPNFEQQPPLTTQVTPQMGEYDEYSRLNGDGEQVRSYTGMGIFNPALVLEEGNFNLVGMNDGVLQAGISADDGTFLAGAGKVILDSDGISLDGSVGVDDTGAQIKWKDSTGEVVANIAAADFGGYGGSGRYMKNTLTVPTAESGQMVSECGDGGSGSYFYLEYQSIPENGGSAQGGSTQIVTTSENGIASLLRVEPEQIRLDSNHITILGAVNRIYFKGESTDLWNTINNAPFTTDSVASGKCTVKTSEPYHFGILTLGSGSTSSNSGGRIGTLDQNPFIEPDYLGAEFLFRPLDAHANNRVVMGFFDSASAFSSLTPTNCNMLTLTGDGSIFTLKQVDRSGGTGTLATLGTLGTNDWCRAQIEYGSGRVRYRIYGGGGDTVSFEGESTIKPTAAMGLVIKAFRTNAANSNIVDVDRIDFYPGGSA